MIVAWPGNERLIQVDVNAEYAAMLATGWEFSENG